MHPTSKYSNSTSQCLSSLSYTANDNNKQTAIVKLNRIGRRTVHWVSSFHTDTAINWELFAAPSYLLRCQYQYRLDAATLSNRRR